MLRTLLLGTKNRVADWAAIPPVYGSGSQPDQAAPRRVSGGPSPDPTRAPSAFSVWRLLSSRRHANLGARGFSRQAQPSPLEEAELSFPTIAAAVTQKL